MLPEHAQSIVENLRSGIPPSGHLQTLTVGRDQEINRLHTILQRGVPPVTLLEANYGTGKSHLLHLIRELALDDGYAVSTVTVDSKAQVRFNRMDQVLGAIIRNLSLPNNCENGIRGFLNLLSRRVEEAKTGGSNAQFFEELSHNWTWDYSNRLRSPALFLAIRGWCTGNVETQQFVEDWLYQPWNYKTQRKAVYNELIGKHHSRFRDPRPEWKFYGDQIFSFWDLSYQQSWDTLADLHDLARRLGFKGLVLLFDEFEDVIQNLQINHRESAYWNLFEFYRGEFPGLSFFAVTPEFVIKTERAFLSNQRHDFDFATLHNLPTFQMTPLTDVDLVELAMRIVQVHQAAYGWSGDVSEQDVNDVVREFANLSLADRVRQVVKEVVRFLDDAVEVG